MPDVLPPVKVRRGLTGFIYRNPAIAFGAALLILMLAIAVLAPLLGTVDPTALAPHGARVIRPGRTGSAPTCSAATSTPASSTARACH
jgi:hypothetical protein